MRYRHVLIAFGWYYPQVHRGIVEYARKHRWHLTADLDDPVPKHWAGDGVLTHIGARKTFWRKLARLNVPIVDLTESRPEIALPRVTIDNAAVGRMAAEFFLNRGYRNCAMVHRWNLGVSRRRLEGFAATLKAAGVLCRSLCLQEKLGATVDSRAARHRQLVHWIKRISKPVGILANRDDEAVEVLDACMAAGLHSPEQVSVLGVDNTDTICDCLQVPLSSIDINQQRVGYEGAKLLDQLMAGKRAPQHPIYIKPGRIIERRSTDVLAIEHPGVAEALRFIHHNYARPIGVPEICCAVAMSRSGLEKAFREHFIRPPGEELRRVRLEQAKKLLLTTDEPLTSVAFASGLQSAQQLCRVFRQQVGATPKQFRLEAHSAGRSVTGQ